MHRLFRLVLSLLLIASAPHAAAAADIIFVMRHLQKAEGADPPLSAEGAANARALAAMLAKSKVTAIFATPTRRAMETAQPLAAKLAIPVTSYDPNDPAGLVKRVAVIPGAVLVVGHSTTVPDLIVRFGGKQTVTLSDQDYGTLFIVDHDSGAVTTIAIEPPH